MFIVVCEIWKDVCAMVGSVLRWWELCPVESAEGDRGHDR
jgi:hypothetical protein